MLNKIKLLKDNFFSIGGIGIFGADLRRENWMVSFAYFLISALLWLFAYLIHFSNAKEISDMLIGAIMIITFFLMIRSILGLMVETKPFVNSIKPYQLIGCIPAIVITAPVPGRPGIFNEREEGSMPNWYKGFLTRRGMEEFIGKYDMRIFLESTDKRKIYVWKERLPK